MHKNKDFTPQIGIDKTVIYNADMQFLNVQAIKDLDNVSITVKDDSPIQSADGIGIGRLKITDKFGALEVGLLRNDIPYQRIAINISDDGDNLQNLLIGEYKARLKEVFKHIKEEYSIVISQDNLLLKEIEINGTFEIEGKFADYRRAILLLVQNLPKKKFTDKKGHNLKYGSWYEVQNDFINLQTIFAANSRVELKIYSKTDQLNQVHDLGYTKDYMRIEYKLKKSDSVCSSLSTNDIAELTDDNLKEFFLQRFQEDIVEPYFKWKAKNKKVLKVILEEHMQKKPRQWYFDFIRQIRQYESIHNTPLLFDLEDIKPIIKELDKGRNYSRKWKKINELANEYENDLKGNNKKVSEIIEKIKKMA